jgi:molecular chaperone GrpE
MKNNKIQDEKTNVGANEEEKQPNPFENSKLEHSLPSFGKEPVGGKVDTGNEAVVNQLKNEKQKLEEELETLKSQYIRLAADFDNFRKRQSSETSECFKSGSIEVLKNIIPVLDSFERAYTSFKTIDDPEKLKESFNVLYRQMQDGVSKMQLVKIKTQGELFDPNYHQAVMQEENSEYYDNAIIAELQHGYMLGDRVIRPSMVKVASNPNNIKKSDQCKNKQEKNLEGTDTLENTDDVGNN